MGKKIAYRLYRIKSNYPSAWLSPEKLAETLQRKNVLKNGDFKIKYRVPTGNIITKRLLNCGVTPADDGGFYLPAGWTIAPGHGWTADCKPVSIKLPEKAMDVLNIRSKGWVSLRAKNAFDGNKTYLLAIQARDGQKNSALTLWLYVYTAEMKYVRTVCYQKINLEDKFSQQLIPLKLNNCEKFVLSLLFSGDVSIKNIMVVSANAALK